MENEDQYHQALKPKYECLLFDLDDTLYPRSSGLSAEVTKNIQEYMLHKLGIEDGKIPQLCVSLYKNYGTTMAGLKAIGYNFQYDDFHGYVHGRLPYDMLKPDPVLRGLLLSLPIRKVDDADVDPISRIEVFDIDKYLSRPDASLVLPRTPVVCKPFEGAYEKVFNIANINPQRTLFFDDSIRNLLSGKRMGLHTVLVGTSHRTQGVDNALESIHNIREALPELWEAEEELESVRYSRKVAIETPVKA
ncbi:hypothetical protein CJ030_MR7G027613 [Morella rubra]|uniref:Suppressor of disruption of TFIIS n=1 Tax=Morella rubra TaxID=262757 RepID=A0A6A1V188_9ROSI|nr:hypothetical protein CJ030_MR7G027613 [Morella rubra]